MRLYIRRKLQRIESERERKTILIYLFNIISSIAFSLFAIKGIVQENVPYAVALVAMTLINLANILYFRRTRRVEVSSVLVVYTMFVLFFILFLFIGKEGTGLYWAYIFQLFAILLTNYRQGTRYSLVLLVLVLFFALADFSFMAYHYTPAMMVRFSISYLIVMAFVNLSEYTRAKTHEAYQESLQHVKSKNEELLTAEEELRQQNEELQALNENIEYQRELIQRNEHRLRTIIHNQGEGLVIIDNKGYFSLANPAAEQIFGYTEGGLVGHNLYELFGREALDALDGARAQAGANHRQSLEITLPSRTGALKTLLFTMSPDTDENNQVQGQIVIFRDITSLKEEEEVLRALNQELHKYFTAIEQSPMAIFITDRHGQVEYANPYYSHLSGYSQNATLGHVPHLMRADILGHDLVNELRATLAKGQTWSGEYTNYRNDGQAFAERSIVSPVVDQDGQVINYVAIQEDITELKAAQQQLDRSRTELERAYRNITASIKYAQTIQQALLINRHLLQTWLPESFVFFRPRDVVGGDFYYANQLGNRTLVAVADCTGHGVPGAFMTLLGLIYLHEIVSDAQFQNPAEVLERLRSKIKGIFESLGTTNSNGLDMALCLVDPATRSLQFAGANAPLYHVHQGQVTEYKGNRNPVGAFPFEKPYEYLELPWAPGDSFFLASDGLQDQFGGAYGDKFSRRRLRELLANLNIQDKPTNQIEQALHQWQGDIPQVDDITLLGFRCPN